MKHSSKLTVIILAASILTGCNLSKSSDSDKTIKVNVSHDYKNLSLLTTFKKDIYGDDSSSKETINVISLANAKHYTLNGDSSKQSETLSTPKLDNGEYYVTAMEYSTDNSDCQPNDNNNGLPFTQLAYPGDTVSVNYVCHDTNLHDKNHS
jgi:hypothetical protein